MGSRGRACGEDLHGYPMRMSSIDRARQVCRVTRVSWTCELASLWFARQYA